MSDEATILVKVSGRVQGIGYRAWTREAAIRRGLSGWVRNDPDGCVTALLSGRPAAVSAMIEAMRIGPPGASVETLLEDDIGGPAPPSFEIMR